MGFRILKRVESKKRRRISALDKQLTTCLCGFAVLATAGVENGIVDKGSKHVTKYDEEAKYYKIIILKGKG